MRRVVEVFLITLTVVATFALTFIAYESNEELRAYKHEFFGVREDYRKLQKEYDDFKRKARNLRKVTILTNSPQSKNVALGSIIETHTKSIDGDVSVYYKNLTTGESVTVDGEKKYNMASLYKVILTLYILEQVKAGNLSLEETVGSPPITIGEALTKIITESNNEYAITLAETYGWENIGMTMQQKLGIEFTFTNDLQATVTNIGIIFEDIALSLKISDGQSEYLLKLLKEQTKTTKLPKYLPKNVYSHNKTGELEGYSHDAGIFYTPKANYILVFMSSTANPSTTEEQMALMSKEIYELLNDVISATPSATQ